MKLLKIISTAFIILLLSLGGCLLYAFKIEPYRLKVNEYEMNQSRSRSSTVKIVQISDLHIKKDFTSDNLEKVVDRVNGLRPDIIIFTGDLYDNYALYHDDENVTAELKKLCAAYGKVAIWGNRDYGGGAVRHYESIVNDAGFTLLKNESLSVELEGQKHISFTGLDDSLLGNPYMPDDPVQHNSDYNILLTHEPDTADQYTNHGYNFVLSGHSHGGQINIPFLPAVNKSAVETTSLSTQYSGGIYNLKGGVKMYVNTGIGTTHISARFGVVPEAALFHLYL